MAFGAIIFSLVTMAIIYSTATILYNLFWSPLRKIPGPWWWAATPFPRLWLYINGKEPQCLQAMHARYGPIVRFAPTEISFIDEQAWKDIYGYKTTTYKDESFYPLAPNTKLSIILADDERHPRQRKVFLPAFSPRALREQTGLLKEYVYMLIGNLKGKQQAGEVVDMCKMYTLTTFDIMADLTFGESMNLLKTQEYNPWLQGIHDQLFYAGAARAFQYFPWVWRIVQLFIPQSVHDAAEASVKLSAARVDKRLAMETERPDIFGLVQKHETIESKMTRHEMHANADLLMMGGTETTSSMLSGLTWNLLNNSGAMDRLTREIREAFKAENDINGEVLARLPYLSACLEESMRIFPSGAVGFRKITNEASGTTICGLHIPPNVGVIVPQYAAYHSAYNFLDPDDFLPERWLAEGTEGFDARFSSDNKGVLQPFSVGPRNCIGMNLAYHEIRLIISHVLWNFDLELSERASKDWLNVTAHVVWDKKPLLVRLSPRKFT